MNRFVPNQPVEPAGARLLTERAKAYKAMIMLNHHAAELLRKHVAVLDPQVVASIEETMGDIAWLWEKAEGFTSQRLSPHAAMTLHDVPRRHQGQERTSTIEQALDNYHEIQTIVDYETQFIRFLIDMDSGDLARTNFHSLLRMHDDYTGYARNPQTRTENIISLQRQTEMGYNMLNSMACHMFGSGAITSPDLRSQMDSIFEEINIKAGYGEGAFAERRFKAARNNYQNALYVIDFAKKLLIYAQHHPALWDDIDTLMDNFQDEFYQGYLK